MNEINIDKKEKKKEKKGVHDLTLLAISHHKIIIKYYQTIENYS